MGTVLGESVSYDYSALAMTATRANFDRSWDIFTDVALHPAFTKEDVDLVKSRLVASLSDDTDEPDTYLQRLQEKVAYAGHPYLNRPEGTAESISRLTADDLRTYHQRTMQTSQLLLVIVGDLDATMLKARITATFGKLPRGTYKPPATPALPFVSSTSMTRDAFHWGILNPNSRSERDSSPSLTCPTSRASSILHPSYAHALVPPARAFLLMRRSPRHTSRSTCRRSGATSSRSPATRCSGQWVPAC